MKGAIDRLSGNNLWSMPDNEGYYLIALSERGLLGMPAGTEAGMPLGDLKAYSETVGHL